MSTTTTKPAPAKPASVTLDTDLRPRTFAEREAELLDEARAAIAFFESKSAIRNSLATFDQETQAKHDALTNEITGFQHHLDPESLDDAQRLVALNQRLKLVESNSAKERDALLARIAQESPVIAGTYFTSFFQKAASLKREQVFGFNRTCYETDASANGATLACHAVQALDRWPGLLRDIPAEVVAQRLKAFVSGERPLWRI